VLIRADRSIGRGRCAGERGVDLGAEAGEEPGDDLRRIRGGAPSERRVGADRVVAQPDSITSSTGKTTDPAFLKATRSITRLQEFFKVLRLSAGSNRANGFALLSKN